MLHRLIIKLNSKPSFREAINKVQTRYWGTSALHFFSSSPSQPYPVIISPCLLFHEAELNISKSSLDTPFLWKGHSSSKGPGLTLFFITIIPPAEQAPFTATPPPPLLCPLYLFFKMAISLVVALQWNLGPFATSWGSGGWGGKHNATYTLLRSKPHRDKMCIPWSACRLIFLNVILNGGGSSSSRKCKGRAK